MDAEKLLQMLREAGLEEEAIKKLLSDTLASLEGPAEEPEAPSEEEEKAEASKYLGVDL